MLISRMLISRTKFPLILCALLLLVACSSDDSSEDPGSGNSNLILNGQSFNATADSSGNANFSFTLPGGIAAFQVSSSIGAISALNGPGGNLLNKPSLVSSGQLGRVTNVPYYSSTSISAGSYNASYAATTGANATLWVFSKFDSNLSAGTLKQNIVLLGPVVGDENTSDALEKALEAERITFARAGITLDILISNFEGPETAPLPGDALYQAIVDSQRQASVTIVIAADRVGSKSNQFKYGTIGSTPFPIVASSDSVAVISIKAITGGDGVFNNSSGNQDQNRILGEEIGRFTALALGLENIVNISGNTVTSSDNLSDTPSCLTKKSCQNESEVRTNLMYPEPLSKSSDDEDSGTGNEFYPRDQLSAQQKQILNNSVFVD